MTPERWRRVTELFTAASELDDAAAADYLDSACAGDAELRTEVESLLGAHAAEEAIVDRPAVERLSQEFVQDAGRWLGRRVGAYEIIAEIGEGGMGEVYRRGPRRRSSSTRRWRSSSSAGGSRREPTSSQRFRAERQILASLDHPNIARLLDGGVTDDGVPYLVMELVEGEPHRPTTAREPRPVACASGSNSSSHRLRGGAATRISASSSIATSSRATSW